MVAPKSRKQRKGETFSEKMKGLEEQVMEQNDTVTILMNAIDNFLNKGPGNGPTSFCLILWPQGLTDGRSNSYSVVQSREILVRALEHTLARQKELLENEQ